MAHVKHMLRFEWPSAMVAIVLLGMSSLAFMAWGPIIYPRVEYEPYIAVYPMNAKPGGHIVVSRKFTVHDHVTIRVTRSLIPIGEPRRPIYPLAETTTVFPPGTYERDRVHELPVYMAPGRYRIEFFAHWKQNILRDVTMPLTTAEIEVKP